jgi:hypothetical protein
MTAAASRTPQAFALPRAPDGNVREYVYPQDAGARIVTDLAHGKQESQLGADDDG